MTEKYIEMCSRNKDVRLEKPVGKEKVLIFDIDYCLYHSLEMHAHEEVFVREAYIKQSGHTEMQWAENLMNFNLFREIFYHVLNMHPLDFVKNYELEPSLVIFHAEKFVLAHLGIEDMFEAVICCDHLETEFMCKPLLDSYLFTERLLGIEDRKNVYFFYDSIQNVNAAESAGWNAFLVHGNIKDYLKNHQELRKINVAE